MVKSDEKLLVGQVAELVADIVADLMSSTFPETRIDSFKGGVNRTGSLVIPKQRVQYFKRLSNKDFRRWPKKYKERLAQLEINK